MTDTLVTALAALVRSAVERELRAADDVDAEPPQLGPEDPAEEQTTGRQAKQDTP
jgi:hypothetical protein